jgi:hypothetical protein
LPPIQKQPQPKQQSQQQQQQQYSRPAPRIVYANELPVKTTTIESVHREFPSLPNLSSLRRFENDEPALKRELSAAAAAASPPVHSPVAQSSPKKLTKVKYNKKNNPFGALDSHVDSDDIDSDNETPLPAIQKQKEQEKSSSYSSSSSSWASIAAGNNKSSVVAGSKQQPQQSQQSQRVRSRFSIVVPTAALPPLLLPPISFKPKPVSNSFDLEKKQQVKKMWGDTDSEDDEEFLKRGLN